MDAPYLVVFKVGLDGTLRSSWQDGVTADAGGL